jgi:hypothetical protein
MAREIPKEHAIETYKSLITIVVEMVKLLAAFNGGGAVALLAYLGLIAGRGALGPDVRQPMLCYLIGLVLCGFTVFLCYVTQLQLYQEAMGLINRRPRYPRWLWLAFSLGFLSLMAFVVGSYMVACRF